MRKCGFDDEAIHTMSHFGSNYSENGVNQAIRTLDPENAYSILELFFITLKKM